MCLLHSPQMLCVAKPLPLAHRAHERVEVVPLIHPARSLSCSTQLSGSTVAREPPCRRCAGVSTSRTRAMQMPDDRMHAPTGSASGSTLHTA
eukprot:COSAG02_NODE_4496_length_5292_cov_16.155979_3_plen_92_part_00